MDILNSIDGRRLGTDIHGRLVGREAADEANAAKVFGRLLYSNTAASSAVTNTSSETLFSTSYTLPANMLKAGSLLRVRYQGIATATNSTNTLAVKLYIGGTGGTALLASGATDVANNDIFCGEFDLICRTVGASGTMVGRGIHATTLAASGTASPVYAILGSTTINTTTSKVIGVSATWSVANAGNSCRLDMLTVELY